MCTTCYIINLSEDFGYKGNLDTDDFAGYKLLCLPLNLSYCRVLTYCEIYIAAKFNTVIATGGVPRAAVCTRLTALGKGVRTYREGVWNKSFGDFDNSQTSRTVLVDFISSIPGQTTACFDWTNKGTSNTISVKPPDRLNNFYWLWWTYSGTFLYCQYISWWILFGWEGWGRRTGKHRFYILGMLPCVSTLLAVLRFPVYIAANLGVTATCTITDAK